MAPLSRVAGAVAPALCSWAPTLSHDPVEVVRTYIEDFKNRQKFSVLFRAFHAGFQHGFGYPGDGGGWASWVATGRGFLSGFPDVQVEVHDLFTHGPYVVESNTATGTHQGWFRGLAPTGRVVQWREVHVYEVERGKIVRNHPVVELEGLVRQLQA
ncbi:MAG: ester cyclase [Myxococcales bacterium]|nr:ester cyclase [Myxococcales bacterium]